MEIFNMSDEFHSRMTELNSAAIAIFATNFSYSPDEKLGGPSGSNLTLGALV